VHTQIPGDENVEHEARCTVLHVAGEQGDAFPLRSAKAHDPMKMLPAWPAGGT